MTLMDRARSRGRHFIAPGIVLACILPVWCPCAFALDPALDVSPVRAHGVEDPRGIFQRHHQLNRSDARRLSLAGYGIRLATFRWCQACPLAAATGSASPLQPDYEPAHRARRDSVDWHFERAGKLEGRQAHRVRGACWNAYFQALEDREGSVWVGGLGLPAGRLCTIHNGSVQYSGEAGVAGHGVFGLYEDSKSNLWAGGEGRTVGGGNLALQNSFRCPARRTAIQGFGESDDGALLIGTRSGIRRFVDGKTEAYPLPGTVGQFQALRLLRDRDGGLWIGTLGQGLVHLHQEGPMYLPSLTDSLAITLAISLRIVKAIFGSLPLTASTVSATLPSPRFL